MKKIKVGMIGTGNISRTAHLPALASIPQTEVTGFFDINPENAKAAREDYFRYMRNENRDVKPETAVIYDSAEEMLRHVDAVDICSSLRYHAYYSAMALERGVAAMSEKPMARTWLEAKQVVEAGKKSSAIFQLNDDNIFLPRYQALRNVVESGMIGDVQNVWTARGSFAVSPRRSDWFYEAVESGGGCIFDYGSHAVCTTWFIVGFDKVPREVRSIQMGVYEPTKYRNGRYTRVEVDDNALFKIRYINPVNNDWINVTIESTWVWPRLGKSSSSTKAYIEVQGSTGTADVYFDEDGQEYVRIRSRAFGERSIPIPSYKTEDESFKDEINCFAKCFLENKRSLLDTKMAAQTIQIINSVQLSHLKGDVTLPLDEIDKFNSRHGAKSPWEAGNDIAWELNAPFRGEKA